MNPVLILSIMGLIAIGLLFALYYTRTMKNTYLNGVPTLAEEIQKELSKVRSLVELLRKSYPNQDEKLKEVDTVTAKLYEKYNHSQPNQSEQQIYVVINAYQALSNGLQQEAFLEEAIQSALHGLRKL